MSFRSVVWPGRTDLEDTDSSFGAMMNARRLSSANASKGPHSVNAPLRMGVRRPNWKSHSSSNNYQDSATRQLYKACCGRILPRQSKRDVAL
ncbi:hypothetical protein AVEN_196547-1 [Araneus ventricosus]|uniref:Uncharacterized protein n=1 Tax=Araneus ventricosus TaxID=182803 RepID=A0A4Y2TRW3_ARAVE|nr:hypothetical protein AVEN_196547-1 [Araneus ventricosus]